MDIDVGRSADKTVFYNPANQVQIVYDTNQNYYRIQNVKSGDYLNNLDEWVQGGESPEDYTADTFNILAIDLRAHGESGGAHSSAGFWERHDVNQVIDQPKSARPAETRQILLFGISLGALRIAGGLVVTVSAWGLLMEPQRHEDRKVADAAPTHGDPEDVAFFPLTMPLTTGPGTIAIAIALSSQQPTDDIGRLSYSAGASVAALVIAAMVWVSYGWSDQVVAMLGARGARIVSRLTAFILLCVGIQIISTGVTSLASTILSPINR